MISLVCSYFKWHYTIGFVDLFGLIRNFLWFFYHFFSIPVLTRTLFSPWERQGERYKKGFDVEGIFETFIINFIMRVVGFVIRSIVIVAGLAVLITVFSLGVIAVVIWPLIPVGVVILFVSGLRLLIK